MSWVLGFIHGFDYLLFHLTLGSVVFRLLILPAGGSQDSAINSRATQYSRTLLALTAVSSIVWLIFSAADMTESWAGADLWTVFSKTDFGHLWLIRIAVLACLFVFYKRMIVSRLQTLILLIAILGLPLISGVTGHGGAKGGPILIGLGIVWLHSVSVGVWTGGLFSLLLWLNARPKMKALAPEISYRVVKRFSHFAMIGTALIGLTGLLMAYLAGVSLLHPLATQYGTLLMGKILLFVCILGAASINQFVHLRRWSSENEVSFAMGIRREVALELILVTGIFILAGFLTRTMQPML